MALFLLPSGEGGAKRRMRVGVFIDAALYGAHAADTDSARYKTRPSPGGRGAQAEPCSSLLPSGEGGAKRRMRVGVFIDAYAVVDGILRAAR
jgi:hypothetical protein